MKLKANADMMRFLRSVSRCRDEVAFVTAEGDVLNLKSQLSLFLFSAIAGQSKTITEGTIQCADEKDEMLLKEYLEQGEI